MFFFIEYKIKMVSKVYFLQGLRQRSTHYIQRKKLRPVKKKRFKIVVPGLCQYFSLSYSRYSQHANPSGSSCTRQCNIRHTWQLVHPLPTISSAYDRLRGFSWLLRVLVLSYLVFFFLIGCSYSRSYSLREESGSRTKTLSEYVTFRMRIFKSIKKMW